MVSVVVVARNEAHHIQRCVQSILNQDYPKQRMELLLVDDHSEDDTIQLARKAANGDSRLRILELGEVDGPGFKKAAIGLAVQHGQGEWIVTTDADCVVKSTWISTLRTCFGEGTDMVSGPVFLTGNSVFQSFQALESMGLIAVGAAAIESGRPTLCNGANLAYRKDSFESVGGFAGLDGIASGDDELLMHKMAAEGKTIVFCKHADCIVSTPAHETWGGFKNQRIRWVSKSRQYQRRSITITLVGSYLAMAFLPVVAAFSLLDSRAPWLLLGLFFMKMLAEAWVLIPAARFFGKLPLVVWLPLEQVAHVAYVLWVGIAANRKQYVWKGRMVR